MHYFLFVRLITGNKFGSVNKSFSFRSASILKSRVKPSLYLSFEIFYKQKKIKNEIKLKQLKVFIFLFLDFIYISVYLFLFSFFFLGGGGISR